jgi:hypothetical protein
MLLLCLSVTQYVSQEPRVSIDFGEGFGKMSFLFTFYTKHCVNERIYWIQITVK